MPAKKKVAKEAPVKDNVIVPASKKDVGIVVRKTTIPMVVQRFAFFPIRFTAPLIMDRKSRRITGKIILDSLKKRDRSLAKEVILQEKTTREASPFQSFYEAIWQYKGGKEPTEYTVKTPCETPGPFGSGIVVPPGQDLAFNINPGFTTTALKAAMVRTAKTFYMTKQTENKAFTNIVKECVHAQAKIFPIEFDEIRMEMFPVKGGHVKFLPVFYGVRARPLISWLYPVINFPDVMAVFCNSGLMCGCGCRRPELGGKEGTFELCGKPEETSRIKAEEHIAQYSLIEEELWAECDEIAPDALATLKAEHIRKIEQAGNTVEPEEAAEAEETEEDVGAEEPEEADALA